MGETQPVRRGLRLDVFRVGEPLTSAQSQPAVRLIIEYPMHDQPRGVAEHMGSLLSAESGLYMSHIEIESAAYLELWEDHDPANLRLAVGCRRVGDPDTTGKDVLVSGGLVGIGPGRSGVDCVIEEGLWVSHDVPHERRETLAHRVATALLGPDENIVHAAHVEREPFQHDWVGHQTIGQELRMERGLRESQLKMIACGTTLNSPQTASARLYPTGGS